MQHGLMAGLFAMWILRKAFQDDARRGEHAQSDVGWVVNLFHARASGPRHTVFCSSLVELVLNGETICEYCQSTFSNNANVGFLCAACLRGQTRP
jgi:hypothetical protein